MSKYQDEDGGGGVRHPLRLPDRYMARGQDRRGDRDAHREYDRGPPGRRPYQAQDYPRDSERDGHPAMRYPREQPYHRSGRGYDPGGGGHPPHPLQPPHSIHINPNVYFNERVRPPGLIAKYPNYEPFHPPPSENFQYPEFMRPRPPKDKTAKDKHKR